MEQRLNREILRLSIPSILANITVPLVGMVDTAIAGHLSEKEIVSFGLLPAVPFPTVASYIGSISVGAMMLSLLYWIVGFLRTGTGGITAQAFGEDSRYECKRILLRALGVSFLVSFVILLLQWPLAKITLLFSDSSPETCNLALRYFLVRIWAAPATVALMALRGWFVGMQDSVNSMLTDLIINAVNVIASLFFCIGLDLGFDGIALGTVVAQYVGFFYAISVVVVKYHAFGGMNVSDCFRSNDLRSFLLLNSNLFIRSICFSVIYIGQTFIAASFGDVLLACNAIIMHLLLLFSYVVDGFAYAGEALTGRFIGAKDMKMTELSVRYVVRWSLGLAVLFMLFYWVAGGSFVGIMTSDSLVVSTCSEFLPWLLLMPILGCLAFAWDGIYLGAVASAQIRNSMFFSMIAFLLVWYVGNYFLSLDGTAKLHLLLAAYFSHLLVRTIWLSVCWHSSILEK
ncbi:MAG: MATE family efflux transporter [Bacteroidales bacterium]|nr:MATE family efflux transporter [Bacteroidales bacterium]